MHREEQATIHELRERLASGDHDVQVAAADRAADLLEAGTLDQGEAEVVIGDLVQVAVHAQVTEVVEQALYAIGTSMAHYRPPLSLVRELAVPALIEHALADAILYIVASTHDRAAEQVIAPYLHSPQDDVRTAAREALQELPGRVGFYEPVPQRYITPAYAHRWRRDVTADLAVLEARFEADYGYPIEDNVVGGPCSQDDLVALVAGRLRDVIPSDVLVWCRHVREVTLPDVANGYFLHAPEVICAHLLGDGVREVRGRYDDDVVVFGSNGGGTLYAARTRSANAIYRLPPGEVLDGVYTSDDPSFAIIATGMVEFMGNLRDAVHAFARDGEIIDL